MIEIFFEDNSIWSIEYLNFIEMEKKIHRTKMKTENIHITYCISFERFYRIFDLIRTKHTQ